MHYSFILNFLHTYSLPILVTSIGGLFYGSFVVWYGRVSFVSSLTLFFTGIIVITCIFLPFNWSIQNANSGKEVSLFFFHLNIEGNNFINDFRNFLISLNIPLEYSQNGITLFLAFLEELAKLTLLILCIKNSLRLPVIMVYLFGVSSFIHTLMGADNSKIVL